MPHISIKGRHSRAVTPLIPLAATLVAVSLGLAACGGSSSTTTQTTANAAATGAATTGTTSTTGTTPSASAPSGTSSTGTTPAGRPNPARFAGLRACLAKKGITVPQRIPGAGGVPGSAPATPLPKGMTRAQFGEALKSCGGGGFAGNHFRRAPGVFKNGGFHKALARFASCLRQNGVNIGEPNTTGKGPIFDTKGINTGSPQFKAASAKCRSTLFSGIGAKAHPGAAASGTTG
jgi:hypothetical protein